MNERNITVNPGGGWGRACAPGRTMSSALATRPALWSFFLSRIVNLELGALPVSLRVHGGGVGRAASAGTGGGARRSRWARSQQGFSGGARGGGACGSLRGSFLHHRG